MAIDIHNDKLIHFSDAVREFPGGPVSLQTLHRWRLYGIRGIKLDSVLIGGLRFTSWQAIDRFIAARNMEAQPCS